MMEIFGQPSAETLAAAGSARQLLEQALKEKDVRKRIVGLSQGFAFMRDKVSPAQVGLDLVSKGVQSFLKVKRRFTKDGDDLEWKQILSESGCTDGLEECVDRWRSAFKMVMFM